MSAYDGGRDAWSEVVNRYLYRIGSLRPCENCGSPVYKNETCAAGCDEPCMCGTDFTCLAREHNGEATP